MGHVGQKPTIRYVGNKAVATFSLATSDRAKTVDGVEIPERTEWHNLVMWDKAAEIAERYIDKGNKLYVEGKLRTRTWQDNNALKHTITEIIVENFEILSRSSQSQQAQ